MKNILITGGAGFIGSSLTCALYERGYHVTVLDSLSPQVHGEHSASSYLFKRIQHKAEIYQGSVTSREDWLRVLEGQDAVIHLAAETGTGQSMYQIANYVDVNIGGTALLLDILANSKAHRVQKVVIASSRSIYGEGKYLNAQGEAVYPGHRLAEDMDRGDFEVKYLGLDGLELVATDESSKIHPSSVYGITKQNQEQLVMTVCPTIGIASVAFRYQNVYGPGQSLTNPYTGILSIFSTLIRNSKAINIFEDGKESRDFVYIDDVVNATILGLTKDEANGEVFNVGTGVPIDVLSVARTLVNAYGIEVPLEITGNYRLGDIRHNYADISKLQHLLGFQPSYDFQRGIESFVKWVNEQPTVTSKFDSSIAEMRSKGLLK
ncbi:NAD-dependent epimerase/dehydratase family protein [Olivibacter sp. CPCC 100613]|uniref:NAD-dependent epimerase/dehydratase family protein n=1 Tax=Olivibacter sp. CPCC 100613 TaxID=3079931 RepID=UPI002FFA3D3C